MNKVRMFNQALGLKIYLSTKSQWVLITFSSQMLHFLLFFLTFQPLPPTRCEGYQAET